MSTVQPTHIGISDSSPAVDPSNSHHLGMQQAVLSRSRETTPEPFPIVHPGDLSAEQAADIEKAHDAMPEEHLPTVGFIIPFPTYQGDGKDTVKDELRREHVPPFLIYCPPPARKIKPPEGQKENLLDKATRHWEKEEDSTRGKTGFKAKAVGVRRSLS